MRFLLPGEPAVGRRVWSPGNPENRKFSINFPNAFRMGFGTPPGRPNDTTDDPKSRKRFSKKSLWGVSGTTFDAKPATLAPCQNTHIYHTFRLKSSSGTTRCRPERKHMPTSLHGWQFSYIFWSPLPYLMAWKTESEPQRVPEGSKKAPQNYRKSIKNPPGQPLAFPGVPGGTPQVPPSA